MYFSAYVSYAKLYCKYISLLFNEIEKIEVAIRSTMNNWITDALDDVFWMTDAANFSSHAANTARCSGFY
ncbi:hypothetical protein FACS1894177_00250 [Bacteroidia bacterium]|nr:hypothetical protein FACS1894177_00250 [Bacteroidia bacterium]